MDIATFMKLDIFNSLESRDLDRMLEIYRKIIDILSDQVNSLHTAKVIDEDWRIFHEPIITKFVFHSLTLAEIFKGTPFKSEYLGCDNNIIDISSISVIGRVLIENYLTFSYFYLDPQNAEEAKLRLKIYECSGLANRQTYVTATQEAKAKLAQEQKLLDKTIEEIVNNPLFGTLDKKTRKAIEKKKPNARIFSWLQILEKSNLESKIMASTWKLLSNYAHSEYISMIQLKGYCEDRSELERVRFTFLVTFICLTSIYIKDHKKMYNILEINYGKYPSEIREKIDIFETFCRSVRS